MVLFLVPVPCKLEPMTLILASYILITSTGSSQFCLEFCAFGAIIQLKKSKDEILEKKPDPQHSVQP